MNMKKIGKVTILLAAATALVAGLVYDKQCKKAEEEAAK